MKHIGTVLGTGHRSHAHVLASRRFAAVGPCRSCRCKAVWVAHGRAPPLEKVCRSKEAFMFPTSSKYNGFDVANQMRRTSYIYAYHTSYLTCSTIFQPHTPFNHQRHQRLFYCIFVECGLQPFWSFRYDETRGALPWSGLDSKTQE